MARCLPNEKYGRSVFFGSMIAEGVIALIWCTLAISFFHTPEALNSVLAKGGPGLVVNEICIALLGQVGGIFAIIGVVVLPITSGDTAFRSARLIVADILDFSQKEQLKRLVIAVPLFVIGFVISLSDFGLIWRYFGWANQTLAAVVLWTAAVFVFGQDWQGALDCHGYGRVYDRGGDRLYRQLTDRLQPSAQCCDCYRYRHNTRVHRCLFLESEAVFREDAGGR